jgi:hypothetical protein
MRTLLSSHPWRARNALRQSAGERQPALLGSWDLWLLRLILAAAAVIALVAPTREAAAGAGIALVASFMPLLLGLIGRMRIPHVVEFAWVLGVALVGVSGSVNLYDRIVYWGKVVHGVEGFLVAVLVGYLLLGYRHSGQLEAHIQVVALVTTFIGVSFGAFWEFLEFVLDWVRRSDLQKSNTDTMTDMLWNNLCVVLGTFFVSFAYYHWTNEAERRGLGKLAAQVFAPIGQLLDQHGRLLTMLVLMGIALYVAALWFSERPLPFVAPR